MWGIIPAAGQGTRIQPLAFSKELLPVGTREGEARPKAVSEYLVDRMLLAGATNICFVIAPGKTDIVEYFGGKLGAAQPCYVVQPEPVGLCDAIFRALPLIAPDEEAVVGLPDTVWFPKDGLRRVGSSGLEFLLFPVEHPERFDAVVTDADGRVREIQVKQHDASTEWIWGAFRLSGRVLRELHALWQEPGRRDPYVGTLVNEWLARGGEARGVKAGERYVDVGTIDGYREALGLLYGEPVVPLDAARVEGQGDFS
jgi:glucose-1-phosphate thymidylyltransferase